MYRPVQADYTVHTGAYQPLGTSQYVYSMTFAPIEIMSLLNRYIQMIDLVYNNNI